MCFNLTRPKDFKSAKPKSPIYIASVAFYLNVPMPTCVSPHQINEYKKQSVKFCILPDMFLMFAFPVSVFLCVFFIFCEA